MNRTLVVLLSALDTVIHAAVGVAAIAATLILLWVFGFGDTAHWDALWPTTAAIWQLGAFVPQPITLPDELLAQMGVDAAAAQFTVSLAPLALTLLTVLLGFRSGVRAARARGWLSGTLTGAVVAAVIAASIALTSVNPVASPPLWMTILFPALLYSASVLCGGVVTAWRVGDDGVIDGVRARVDTLSPAWRAGVDGMLRGTAVAVAALVAVSAVAAAVAVIARSGNIVSLFQSGSVDLAGAVFSMIAQLAWLPTVIIWTAAWVAGPGFAVGVGTSVAPAGVDLGVVPGIPILGALPEIHSTWLLLVVLLPVAAGCAGGWVARRGAVRAAAGAPSAEPFLPRLVTAGVIGALAAGIAAVLGAAASGSIGPGSLASMGPHPGALALAVGAEVLIGASITLLAPLARNRDLTLAGDGSTEWSPAADRTGTHASPSLD